VQKLNLESGTAAEEIALSNLDRSEDLQQSDPIRDTPPKTTAPGSKWADYLDEPEEEAAPDSPPWQQRAPSPGSDQGGHRKRKFGQPDAVGASAGRGKRTRHQQEAAEEPVERRSRGPIVEERVQKAESKCAADHGSTANKWGAFLDADEDDLDWNL